MVDNNIQSFSIVVPVRNASKTLKKCIDSILANSINDIEIILVENGSIDNSGHLCQELANSDTRIKYFSINSAGVSEARNYGLSRASGNIIGFCDCDDYYEDGALDHVSDVFINNEDCSIVCFGYNLAILNKDIVSYHFKCPDKIMFSNFFYYIIEDERIFGSVWNKFYKKELLTDIKFDTTLTHCEDTYFNCDVVLSNPEESVYVSDKALYYYVKSNNNATSNANELYTENGSLKYIQSVEKIKVDFRLSKKQIRVANFQIVSLAVHEYYCSASNDCQKHYLVIQIKKYIKDALLFFLTHPNIKRFKIIIKSILLLIKGK